MHKKLVTLAALALSAEALAQGLPPAPSQQGDAQEPPLCTDRPTKSNAACTVPAGAIQIETDLIAWTRTDAAGTRVDTIAYTNPTLKLGLGRHTDVQFNIAPYVETRVRTPDGAVERIGGAGDLVLRLKQRLTDPDAALQVGVIPFVKAPTAKRGVGNREWEGGVAVPVQYALPRGVTLTFGPEVDLLHDADGRGKHVQLVGTANIAKAVAPTVGVAAELWTAQNYDPAGTVRQYSADVAVTWLVRPRLQLDAGANFGLNRATPDAQAYLGLSTRF
ncbi:transporter [Sphingomonas lenta]|uniref:Transporter n=1 Tax=Sphingomonas lenta TaxID=1141887 RepID=A0A2A2SFG1_9SPHN|nr:transporter [Sphingomonas lenta]PAX07979.1 hypothetical protein CKY28_10275 [Sphingomonas lenta]